MHRSITGSDRPTADHSRRGAALAAAVGLLSMAILAPFAQFGVLASLIMPTDAVATTSNIAASTGLFGAGIAALMIVAVLDVVVAWGMYVVLRPVNQRVALAVAWLRVAYAVVFAYALLNLLDVAQLLNGATAATLQSDQLQTQVATSVTAFRDGWDLALAIFGLHLVGLGGLLYRSVDFPRFLGALVILAGIGYLADSFGRILVPGYTLTISTFTFVGEALLIVWLFKLAIRGPRSPDLDPLPEDSMTLSNVRHTACHRLFPLVAVSLIVGFLLPVVLALGPASGGGESRMTGAALLGWGIGWTLIALLSIRFTDQPQRWAVVPAGILGVTGIALIAFAPGAPVMDRLAWVWPVPVLVLAVWLILRVRRDLQGRSRWLLYPVVGVLAMLAVGGAIETVIEATDGGRSADRGELVDVGGYKLFISCSGTGSPTVVLEGGAGQGSAYFARIAPEVASTTRVCTYDRAGRGQSEPATGSQDGAAIARDLHALLAASGNQGPYILAGHSSGGVYVRFFAAAYANEVAGVVLLDAQSPHATPVKGAGQSAGNPISTLSGVLPGLARVGLARLVLSAGSSDLPPETEARRHADEVTVQGVSSFGDEFSRLDGILDAAGSLPDLGDRPLIVVTAAAEPLEGWLVQQDRLQTLSTHVSHRVFPDLTHVSLIESPKGATAASDAIVAVVSSVRTGTRLDLSTTSHR